jgi:hypothetical protein
MEVQGRRGYRRREQEERYREVALEKKGKEERYKEGKLEMKGTSKRAREERYKRMKS